MKDLIRAVALGCGVGPERVRVVCTVHGATIELLDPGEHGPDPHVMAGCPIGHGTLGAAEHFRSVLTRRAAA